MLDVPSGRQKPIDVRAKVEEYAAHLRKIASIFDTHARELGLGVRLDAERAIQIARSGNVSRVMRFCDRLDDSGVLHDAQLMTALDCVGELLTSPERNGLVLGAMQSGKTTTSLALQFAGPIVYVLTRRCLYPIYLITSHTSQEDQTKIEISRFLDFYGELAVVLDDKHRCTLIEYARKSAAIDPVFEYSPTITTYREHVLKKALPDTMMGPRLDDFIQRRVPGESIKRIADLCRKANAKGFAPLLIIDEPQFGASDRLVTVEESVEWRACVLQQIFDRVDEALGPNAGDQVFIGLSATPYELHDINAVWKVNQYLTSAYCGFNYFGGKVIDLDVDVTPPNTMSFGAFGEQINVPFLGKVSLAAYDAEPQAFGRFARKIGYEGSQDEYRRQVEDALRAAILYMARNGSTRAAGICIRLFNNNIRSHRLIQNLYLPKTEIEVIEYFGSDHKGRSVKRAIRERTQPDLPFLIAVTSRARMGDAFPREVEWFLEFSKKATNLNALLQGLLGRACGYGKRSTVVMSQENADLVEDYKREQGAYIYKTSRHSLIAGPYRRGAPTNLIRVSRDMADPLIARFFERIDAEVVAPHILQGSSTLRARRSTATMGYRTGPILRIAEELGLFAHLESKEVRKKFFPTYPGFRIARANDEVKNSRSNETLRYTLAPNGDNRFTFREWVAGTNNHAGIRSRGYGANDASDKGKAGNTLEPQVNMRKFDRLTGEPINDKRINGELAEKRDRQIGDWRVEMVTLPLVAAVRELQAGEATYPVERSPFARDMSRDERIRAGFADVEPSF